MVELTFASKDDLVYVFVHAIVRKIIVAHGIFSSYLGTGQMFGVNYKVSSNLCDPKVGWRACCQCILIISSLSLIHYQVLTWCKSLVTLEKKEFELHFVIVHSKFLMFFFTCF
jgi:hypothetical protein